MSQVIEIAGHKFKLIGDPHLGRVFKTGVPTHRLGDRERLVEEQFYAEISDRTSVPVIIMVTMTCRGMKRNEARLMYSKDFALKLFSLKVFGRFNSKTATLLCSATMPLSRQPNSPVPYSRAQIT